MKNKRSRVFKGAYYLIKLLFFSHLLYFLLNLFLNYSVPFDKKSQVTIRGHISGIENNWKPTEVNNLDEKCESTFLYFKSGFVRFDFNNWKDALDKNSVLYIVLYNLWLIMGVFISFQLYTVLKTLYKKGTFEKKNTFRLQFIATTIIFMPVVKNFAQKYFTSFAQSNFAIEGHVIQLSRNNSFYQFPYLPYLVVGLLIFAIIEIYKEGMRLQTETNLTI